jgi:hypothetical protein
MLTNVNEEVTEGMVVRMIKRKKNLAQVEEAQVVGIDTSSGNELRKTIGHKKVTGNNSRANPTDYFTAKEEMEKRKAPELISCCLMSFEDDCSDPFTTLPVDVLFYFLRFLNPNDMVPLCLSSRTYAALMRDLTFSGPIRRVVKRRKLERESALLAEAQDHVRVRIQRDLGAPIDVFSNVCSQHPEFVQNADFQTLLLCLQIFLDKKVAFE